MMAERYTLMDKPKRSQAIDGMTDQAALESAYHLYPSIVIPRSIEIESDVLFSWWLLKGGWLSLGSQYEQTELLGSLASQKREGSWLMVMGSSGVGTIPTTLISLVGEWYRLSEWFPVIKQHPTLRYNQQRDLFHV